MTRSRLRWIGLVAVMGFALGCGSDSVTATPAYILSVTNSTPIVVVAGSFGDSIRVGLTDPKSGRFPGQTVSFTIVSGGGSLSSTSVTTGPLSTATVLFKPDTKVGETLLRVSVADVSTNITIITAAGPPASAAFAAPIVLLDSGTVVPISVTVADQFGNPIAPAQAALVFRTPNVATNNNGSYLGVRPGQTFAVGASRDSQLVVVTRPNSPLLTTDLSRLSVKADTTLTVTVTLDMHGAPEKAGSLLLRVAWDPSLFSYVSSSDPGNGAAINTSQAASGAITLALASSGGFAAKIDVLRLTLKAGSIVGRSGSLSLTFNEMFAATSFNDLKPRAVAVTYPLVIR